MKQFEQSGTDSNGEKYKNLEELWNSTKATWYKSANVYWDKIETTVDGMLGGFANVDPDDVKESTKFIKSLSMKNFNLALDCGAGIGRVTKHLLTPLFSKTDLVEQSPNLIGSARKFIENDDKIGELYNFGLQKFKPEKSYDLVWIQWTIGHLRDDDFIDFMKKLSKNLAPDGFICLKENLTTNEFIFDNEDSSITRTDEHFKYLFKKSNLELKSEAFQIKFPDYLFKVKMYALQPIQENK
eukprot:gene5483-9301_t